MTEQQTVHYKENSPERTVDKLISILHSLGLDTVEDWRAENSIGTYSLRVRIKGCGETGTNGKGVSPVYARASAYAELFERLQNGILIPSSKWEKGDAFSIFPDEKILSSENIVEQNGPFLKYYLSKLNYHSLSKKEIAKRFRNNHQWEYLLTGKDNEFICIPYSSYVNGKKYYLPAYLSHALYGSNGMCAGNTTEEALVQGISEIVERAVQTRIMREKPCLPDIPSDYMKKYPYVYEIFQKLQQVEGCEVYMKDGSLGGKYPVAVLIIVEKNTGHFGVKLGCHPDFGIAMERTLTELTQGQTPIDYAHNSSTIDFRNAKVETQGNILNTFMIGRGQYPYQLLSDTPSYEFVPMKDVSELSNKEILDDWIKDLSRNYDILVHDVSYLGFPSFHIIIPGLSEMRTISESLFREENTRMYASYLLKSPSEINEKNCIYLLGALESSRSIVMMRSVKTLLSPDRSINIPFKKYEADNIYLSAMCYIMRKEYLKAYQNIGTVASIVYQYQNVGEIENVSDDITRLKALLYYLQAIVCTEDKNKSLDYIGRLFDNKTRAWIYETFYDEAQVIQKQYYPVLDEKGRDEFNNLKRVGTILRNVMANSKLS